MSENKPKILVNKKIKDEIVIIIIITIKE